MDLTIKAISQYEYSTLLFVKRLVNGIKSENEVFMKISHNYLNAPIKLLA
jgi:hypothetical protein